MDYTTEKRAAAWSKLTDYERLISQHADIATFGSGKPDPFIIEALADDLNTHLALSQLDRLANHAQWNDPAASLIFLGFYAPEELARLVTEHRKKDPTLEQLEKQLQEMRLEAVRSRNFAAVDDLKAKLIDAGVRVQMKKDSVDLEPDEGFDAAKLEALL